MAKARATSVKNEDYSALKVDYVSWLLDPEKSPKTQQAWAIAHNLTPETVSRWKRDEFVLDLLKRANELLEPVWARVLATLVKIATDPDHINCVSAIKELGKLMKKYPNEKLEVNVVDRVAYVQPGALAAYSRQIEEREAQLN